ncbi:MAG: hypothetical protein V4592_04195 [Bacteroidota bacterium]
MPMNFPKTVSFLLKLILAVFLIFCVAVVQHDIGGIDNRAFAARLQRSKDTVFMLTFFSSWQRQQLRPGANIKFGQHPLKHLLITLDQPGKRYYSTIPYLITHEISRDVYFITADRPAGPDFSLICSKNPPGSWYVFRTAGGGIKMEKAP